MTPPQQPEVLSIQMISGNEKTHELKCIDKKGDVVIILLPLSYQCLHPEEKDCEAMCPVDIALGESIKIFRSRPATTAPCPQHKIWQHCPVAGDIAAQAREGESIRWATAINTLIATESKRKSKEDVNMVYSYRVAQTIESLRSSTKETPK